MKKLFLSRKQAKDLASDLTEYAGLQDSSIRDIFQGFEISFGDVLAHGIQDNEEFELTPIPNYTLIQGAEVPEED
jgi:hypothetical protein